MPWAVVFGIILVSFSLRGPFIAPTPLLGLISEDLAISAAAAGLLTSLPVLCFALTTPLAAQVVRRAGPELAIVICLLGVLAGTVIRSAGPVATVFAGSIIIGAAIMIGNIVMPVIVRRDVPWRRVGTVTGIYTAAMNVGGMTTSLTMAPLASVMGWRWALASWGILAVLGLLYWGRRARQRPAPKVSARPAATKPTGSVSRIGWLLMLAFGGQTFAYYGVTTWLPTLLSDTRGLGASASGAAASIFQVTAIIGAFGVPVLAARARPWVPMAVVAACWCTLPIGLYAAPEHFILWTFIGGIAHGGAYTAIFSILAQVARSDGETAGLSARVQFGGYITAAFGGPVIGALNTATGTWSVPLLGILVATIVFTVTGLGAAIMSRGERPARI